MKERDIPEHIHSFAPIINESSEVLILGTIPGPESLRKRQYYANPNNQFWSIIYSVYDEKTVESSYEDKICFLLDHRIALWDVYYSADRLGALDADIKNPELNDIKGLLHSHPCIKRILLAGRTAEKVFGKYFPDVSIESLYIPSASSAYAKKPIDEKTHDWKNALYN